MKTFLSVDLDYFACRPYRSAPVHEEDITGFLKKIAKLNVPKTVVIDHHHMFADLYEHRPDKIVHVDYHSDLTRLDPKLRFDEGTYFCFLPETEKIDYLWVLPDRESCIYSDWGLCYYDEDGRAILPKDVFKTTKTRVGTRYIPWKEITFVSIALSPDWTAFNELGRDALLAVQSWTDDPDVLGKIDEILDEMDTELALNYVSAVGS